MESFPLLFGLLCGGFFFLVTLAIGVGLIIFSRRSKKKADASLTWPSVLGKVLATSVRESITHDEDGRQTVSYYPEVEYTYEVNGQDFTSKRLSFGGLVTRKTRAEVVTHLTQYPVDSTLLVYHNPQNPREAVIERTSAGAKWALVVGVIISIIAACIGLVMLISLVRNLG